VSSKAEEPKKPLVTLAEPQSPASEAYRALRTNLQFSSLDKPLRIILITGVDSGEGKSTTLANLAVVMAQGGKHVVAVDCDLRRPSLHNIFGVPVEPGLTTAILEGGAAPVCQKTVVDGLEVVASGQTPPNPSELLGSRQFDDIMAGLLKQADVLLLDTPPVVAVSDAAILASKVDGVLLVVNAGKTKRDSARRAKSLLAKVNANILGVVLNNAPLDRSMYTY
jgi:capsular exopolysaccharide synthesis family protein